MIRSLVSISFFVVCLITTSTLLAQSVPPWKWLKRGGAVGPQGGQDRIIDKATDQDGNLYILADNIGHSNVDGHNGLGPMDRVSLASWDCAGNLRWTKTFGGGSFGSTVYGLSLGTDTVGGVYVLGYMNLMYDTIYFDSDTTFSQSQQTFFLIKYNTLGSMQWFKTPVTGPLYSTPQWLEMDIAPGGDIFALAYLTPGNYDSGAINITSNGCYVLKYNSSGNYLSNTKLDMQISILPFGFGGNLFSFRRDNYHNRFYVAGTYDASILGGSFMVGNTPVVSMDTLTYSPIFLAAFDDNGNNFWVRQGSSDKTSTASLPKIGTNGVAYLGGISWSGNIFNGYSINNTTGPGIIHFIIAVDSNGNNIWGTNASLLTTCTFSPFNYDLACANDTIAFVGTNNGQLQWGGLSLTVSTPDAQGFLGRFNASTGAVISLDPIVANEYSCPNGVAMDRHTNIFTAGTFKTGLSLGSNSVTSTDTSLYGVDWFVAKYGTQDNCDREPNDIDEVATSPNISVFPNPASQIIHIGNAPEYLMVDIYSLTGSLVSNAVLKGGRNSIDVSYLSPGLYIIHFTDVEGMKHYSRFVKE